MPTTHGCASAEEDKQCSRWTTGDHKQDYNVVGSLHAAKAEDAMPEVGSKARKYPMQMFSLIQCCFKHGKINAGTPLFTHPAIEAPIADACLEALCCHVLSI
eukprot:1162143-Pelagomonas_calceolata.AAC.26